MKQRPRTLLAVLVAALLQIVASLGGPEIAFSAPASPPAPQSPVSVTVDVSPKEGLLGDLFMWTLKVQRDADIAIIPPSVESVDGFDIVNQTRLPDKTSDRGQILESYQIQLRADRIGELVLPEQSIQFEAPASSGEMVPGQISAPASSVSIQSLLQLQGDANDIRDIKPLRHAPPDYTWAYYSLLALALLGWAFYWLRQRRRAAPPETASAVEDFLPPDEEALRALEQVRKDHPEPKACNAIELRQLYFTLSEIFRRYLEKRFDFPALDWTSEEIIKWSESDQRFDPATHSQMSRLLKRTDLIKFARAQAPLTSDDLEAIRSFVIQTRTAPTLESVQEKRPSATMADSS
ncbi:MAG: hypothetical protein G3M78_09655 [Candidatus Nitrohelix vancouverensis]|uniref:Protein BatD n=1 Tax=Candidatus Nitrohelix vancouverensis TaxID=2705534 RepID=A0A7T0G3S8_9BACT|nr:MAG: hypothetical protein G3M78_09655 [Candidatus Nitrohelix vancouverensis]